MSTSWTQEASERALKVNFGPIRATKYLIVTQVQNRYPGVYTDVSKCLKKKKKVREKRQISYTKEFQTIYVVTTFSRKWNITLHYLRMCCK